MYVSSYPELEVAMISQTAEYALRAIVYLAVRSAVGYVQINYSRRPTVGKYPITFFFSKRTDVPSATGT